MQTLLVVAANRFFRESLIRLFRTDSGIRVLGGTEFSPLTPEQVARENPDVVALCPEWDDRCFYATRSIHEAAPQVKILMIGMKDDKGMFLKAVRAGATGYLLKDASTRQILAATHRLAQDAVVCPPHLERALFALVAGSSGFDPFTTMPSSKLTPREEQLSYLVAQGLSNKEIATRLNLSLQTVKNHVHSILRKTQSKNRSALAHRVELQPPDAIQTEEAPRFLVS